MSGRPIFIIATPRSGTTLLTALLHAHPSIAMPPETRFLPVIYRERESFGDLRVEANRRRVAERITAKGTMFGDLRMDKAQVIEAVTNAPPTLGSLFATVWQEFARSRGKRRWGEKRPAYWREPKTILRLFPTAQIIHLVRDPRACAASLNRVTWWPGGVPRSAAVWHMSNRDLDRLGRGLSADQYYRLRYEDLFTDQRAELERLCQFLGEDFDEAMITHSDAARDIVPARKKWHKLVEGPLDSTRVEAWRRELAPAEIGLVELIGRRQMARHGYQRSDVAARPAAGDIAAALKQLSGTRRALTRQRFEDARIRRRFPMPLASQV